MADVFTAIIRYVHIYTAVMWVGGIFLWSMLIAPSLARRVPPQAAGPVMRTIVPRLTNYFTIAGVAAILSGMWLIYQLWGSMGAGFGPDTPRGYGIAMTLGLLGALTMIVIALAYIKPAAKKMLAFPPPQPGAAPPAELPALQKRLMIGGMVNMLLGTLVLAAMVWAVNVSPF